MRSLTTIEGKSDAEVFVAYLLTLGISTHVEPASSNPQTNESTGQTALAGSGASNSDTWEVWIKNEDRLAQAKEELVAFLANSKDPKYTTALRQANQILKEQREEARLRQRNLQTPRLDHARSSMFRGKLPPLTLTLIILCCIFGFLTAFSKPSPENRLGVSIVKQLQFVDMGLYLKSNDPASSLKKGELWRVITPAFLHGDPIHLLMNMLALASLGRLVERMIGIRRYALLLVLLAVGSHLPQGLLGENLFGVRGLSGSPNFVGISGVVMGLFGYIAIRTKLNPNLGFSLSPQSYFMVAILLVIGFAGEMFGNVGNLHMANFAHLGGLVSGVILGFISEQARR
jgi:GlpG protein